ncbi:MAG TPA: nucleotide sugar dehydrogenase [Bosea sp. (in: a-proteobacteria)]|jgi:UDP-N-acetyl-D-glucosamine dehydrogenase|uniref:nucleotide sugar dehydrogenase n=1 Tax=Bosea sp. (in: a-proteobacteria) TaxID=1871050 RepID=UPI002E0D3FB8|nr:nucleotide sugar dehydrogenase [Bosea sp. (in: a-proteobacteria)]
MTDSIRDELAGTLLRRLEDGSFKVGIIGLGYVGLPLALAVARAGFAVVGFDINTTRVRELNQGHPGIKHIAAAELASAIEARRFSATDDFSRLDEPDGLVICVPTPLTRNREPDLSFVVRTAEAIAKQLRKGQIIVLESTTYPGTTEEVIKPILERTGLKSGVDFYLAFSPEREDPGNPHFETASIPKVVGGDDPEALRIAQAFYGKFIVKTVAVSSTATAEAVKLTENIFRSVNIALVNELKLIYAAMGIDVWEVIEAAKTKPFGYMPFYPGPGLGGHCIPIDPFYLSWKAREFDITARFIELAGEINTAMPRHVVDRLAQELDRRFGRGLNGAKILVIGVAYKKNVDDMRESPSLRLIELFEQRGASVDYHDPHVPVIPPTREHAALAGRRSVGIAAGVVAEYDALLIATDHDVVDYKALVAEAKLVVDTRNACARSGALADNVAKA